MNAQLHWGWGWGFNIHNNQRMCNGSHHSGQICAYNWKHIQKQQYLVIVNFSFKNGS